MSLHLWEAVHDANARSDPLFDIDPEAVTSEPPSLQRVLLAAATLWCRTLAWPSVREIESTAAVAASTSINAVGSSAQLRVLLVESERRTIWNLGAKFAEESPSVSNTALAAFEARMGRLGAIDPMLPTLPVLAGLALDDPMLVVFAMAAFVHGVVEDLSESSEVA